MTDKIKIDAVAYHRNGVAGEGFHAVLFRRREGRAYRPMAAAVFEGKGRVAVFDIGHLAEGTVAPTVNAWRSDDYEADLREAIETYESKRGVLEP